MPTDMPGFAVSVVGFDFGECDGLVGFHSSACSSSLWMPNLSTSACSWALRWGAGLVMGEPFVDDLIDVVGSESWLDALLEQGCERLERHPSAPRATARVVTLSTLATPSCLEEGVLSGELMAPLAVGLRLFAYLPCAAIVLGLRDRFEVFRVAATPVPT